MIKEQLLYERFMESLRRKVSNKTLMVKILTDILMIEKDAVYRRMRGEVNFTFAEIASIANQLGISLDSIIGSASPTYRPSHLKINRHGNPTDADYRSLSDFNERIKSLRQHPEAEIAEICNILPQIFSFDLEMISRFNLFIWGLTISEEGKHFQEVTVPERTRKLYRELFHNMRCITSKFIWDNMLFQYMVNEIKYNLSIHRMEPEDARALKEELHRLLDYTEKICINGKFDEGGTAYLFISDITIYNNYMYVACEDYHCSMVKVFILDSIISYDRKFFEQTKICINAVKQVSTLISVSGGRSRTIFFDRQRKIVDSL
ncbi:MAG: hypothetical protein LBF89_04675 [Bacteroidales bacterium]|jgi:hypothetical protein|nr:hypothetical protein [Bacteroidales bacterium]